MAKNPYEILGIKKDATDAQIKSAYRKLAKKHHPDLNPNNKNADEKFKELNTANNFLSNADKRAAFDAGLIDMDDQPLYGQRQQEQGHYRDYADGPQGQRYNFNGGGFDFSDLEGLFGGLGGRGNRTTKPSRESADAHYRIDVDFLEAALGAQKHITMPDGKTLNVNIPEGIAEGQKLRLKGMGKQPSGDAYVEVHINPHPLFKRTGNDISLEVPISLQESVLGEKIKIQTIHGAGDMAIPKGAGSGITLRLKGKGIKGADQYVKIKLVMPKEIDIELEQAIRKWSETHAYNPRAAMEDVT